MVFGFFETAGGSIAPLGRCVRGLSSWTSGSPSCGISHANADDGRMVFRNGRFRPNPRRRSGRRGRMPFARRERRLAASATIGGNRRSAARRTCVRPHHHHDHHHDHRRSMSSWLNPQSARITSRPDRTTERVITDGTPRGVRLGLLHRAAHSETPRMIQM